MTNMSPQQARGSKNRHERRSGQTALDQTLKQASIRAGLTDSHHRDPALSMLVERPSPSTHGLRQGALTAIARIPQQLHQPHNQRPGRSRNESAGFNVQRPTRERRDRATRFLHDECPRGDVPDLRARRPIGIERPRRHVTQIERRGTHPPKRLAMRQHRQEILQLPTAHIDPCRKAYRHERLR